MRKKIAYILLSFLIVIGGVYFYKSLNSQLLNDFHGTFISSDNLFFTISIDSKTNNSLLLFYNDTTGHQVRETGSVEKIDNSTYTIKSETLGNQVIRFEKNKFSIELNDKTLIFTKNSNNPIDILLPK